MIKSPGLHRVSEPDLLRLLRTISREQMPLPITRAGLLLTQFAAIEADLDALVGQSKQSAIRVLSAVLRERRERPSRSVSLAWDGPSPTGAGSRRPSDLLLELIATAQQSVLLTGAELERDRALLGSLHAATLGRELEVCVVLAAAAPEDLARLRSLSHDQFHDPAFRARLHLPAPDCVRGEIPFCLLVDHQRGLLLAGAAPLLESDDRSVTAGFLIDDAEAVVALETQWQTLIHTAALLPLSATPAT
jgi:hypothetical protein